MKTQEISIQNQHWVGYLVTDFNKDNDLRLTSIVDQKHTIHFIYSFLSCHPDCFIHPFSRAQIHSDAVNHQLLLLSEAPQLLLQLLQQSLRAGHQQEDRARLQQGGHLDGQQDICLFALSFFNISFFLQVEDLLHVPAPIRILWRLLWWYRWPGPESWCLLSKYLTSCQIFSGGENTNGQWKNWRKKWTWKEDYSSEHSCFYTPTWAGRTNAFHELYFTLKRELREKET